MRLHHNWSTSLVLCLSSHKRVHAARCCFLESSPQLLILILLPSSLPFINTSHRITVVPCVVYPALNFPYPSCGPCRFLSLVAPHPCCMARPASPTLFTHPPLHSAMRVYGLLHGMPLPSSFPSPPFTCTPLSARQRRCSSSSTCSYKAHWTHRQVSKLLITPLAPHPVPPSPPPTPLPPSVPRLLFYRIVPCFLF